MGELGSSNGAVDDAASLLDFPEPELILDAEVEPLDVELLNSIRSDGDCLDLDAFDVEPHDSELLNSIRLGEFARNGAVDDAAPLPDCPEPELAFDTLSGDWNEPILSSDLVSAA